MADSWATSGDTEIDAVRREMIHIPTEGANFPYRLGILTTWLNLLQRQAVDLAGYAPIFDRLTDSNRAGDFETLYATMHDAFAYLDACQRNAGSPSNIEERLCETGVHRENRQILQGEANPSPDWPLYGGNIHHTASTDDPGPEAGRLAWQQAVGLAWYVSPAVEDGRVYIASPGIRGMLHCLNLQSGETIWKTRRTWTRNTLGISNLSPSSYVVQAAASTPLILDDAVVVNELGAQGRDLGGKHLLIIDKASGELRERIPAGEADYRLGCQMLAGDDEVLIYPSGTQRVQANPPQMIGQNRIVCKSARSGETLWDFNVGLTFCEPVVDGGQVFTGTQDGVFYALNIHTGSGEDYFGFSDESRVAWAFMAGAGTNSAAAVMADRVIFGANDGVLHCLDRASGQPVWSSEVNEKEPHAFKYFSKPVIANERVYVGSAGKRLYCFDLHSGRQIWQVCTSDWVRSVPVVVGDSVFAAAMDGTVYGLQDSGDHAEIRWTMQAGEYPIYADLVYASGKLLINASDLMTWCLDVEDGAVVWQHHALDQAIIAERTYQADVMACGGWYQSKPTAADGKVFIGTPSRFIFAYDYASGEEIWRYEVGGAVSGAPAYDNGRIYIGQKSEEYFYCLDAVSGDLVWKQMVGWVWSSCNVHDGRVFIPGNDGYVSCLDADTGNILWRYRTGRGTAPEPPIDGGRVYFGSWDHFVYALDTKNGKLIWQFHTGGSPDSGAPIAYENRLYIPMGGNRVVCLDGSTGDIVWEYRLTEGDMNASPALWGDKLFISLGVRPGAIPIASRIQCLDTITGTMLWEHPGGGITGPAVADGKVYFGSTADPYFKCVDANNGQLLWRYEMGERVYESVPCIYGRRVYILSETGHLFGFE